jgi:hypothetical protein
MTPLEIADVIERFLDERSLYPEEWVEFAETPQHDKKLDVYRKRCDQLDPLVNRPGEMDPTAVAELREMIDELREIGTGSKPETVE